MHSGLLARNRPTLLSTTRTDRHHLDTAARSATDNCPDLWERSHPICLLFRRHLPSVVTGTPRHKTHLSLFFSDILEGGSLDPGASISRVPCYFLPPTRAHAFALRHYFSSRPPPANALPTPDVLHIIPLCPTACTVREAKLAVIKDTFDVSTSLSVSFPSDVAAAKGVSCQPCHSMAGRYGGWWLCSQRRV